MKPKDLIKADSDTFWKYMHKTAPKRGRTVYIAPDRTKQGRKGKGKSKGPS